MCMCVCVCVCVCVRARLQRVAVRLSHLEGGGGEQHVSGLSDVSSVDVIMVGHITMVMVF